MKKLENQKAWEKERGDRVPVESPKRFPCWVDWIHFYRTEHSVLSVPFFRYEPMLRWVKFSEEFPPKTLGFFRVGKQPLIGPFKESGGMVEFGNVPYPLDEVYWLKED